MGGSTILLPPCRVRQEAQRLGRILRPKPQAQCSAGGFNAPRRPRPVSQGKALALYRDR